MANHSFKAYQIETATDLQGTRSARRTVVKPEQTVTLPCGCKSHYDCLLHELRAQEVYIFAEETPYFACPTCNCEYTEQEQRHMEDQLSFHMPEDYQCRLWDADEGVWRAILKANHDKEPRMGYNPSKPTTWSEGSLAPDIYTSALHPDYKTWCERWGEPYENSGNVGLDPYWLLNPRGPTRRTKAEPNEKPGATIKKGEGPISMDPDFDKQDGHCSKCVQAARLEDIWNRSKEYKDQSGVYHCCFCDDIVIEFSRWNDGSFIEQEAHKCEGDEGGTHRYHFMVTNDGLEPRDHYPVNHPRSIKAQLDEGGRPWGNIPDGIKLGFENSDMERKREDFFEITEVALVKRRQLQKKGRK